MPEHELVQKLRDHYADRDGDVKKRILDSFANKERWRAESLVHRVAQETKLTDREVRNFFRDILQDDLKLGQYKKGAQGYRSRFCWNIKAGYCLIQVGLAAQGRSETLMGSGPIDSDEEDKGDIAETTLPIRPNAAITVTFPNDLTESEFTIFVNWFKAVHLRS